MDFSCQDKDTNEYLGGIYLRQILVYGSINNVFTCPKFPTCMFMCLYVCIANLWNVGEPTWEPSKEPTTTSNPSNMPTKIPSINPSMKPSDIPTKYPTVNPTNIPTNMPSISPTVCPYFRNYSNIAPFPITVEQYRYVAGANVTVFEYELSNDHISGTTVCNNVIECQIVCDDDIVCLSSMMRLGNVTNFVEIKCLKYNSCGESSVNKYGNGVVGGYNVAIYCVAQYSCENMRMCVFMETFYVYFMFLQILIQV